MDKFVEKQKNLFNWGTKKYAVGVEQSIKTENAHSIATAVQNVANKNSKIKEKIEKIARARHYRALISLDHSQLFFSKE